MRKKITLLLFSLCLIHLYGQETAMPTGKYVFEKAELVIERYDSKEIIEHKTVTDTTTIDPYNIHWKNTFFRIELRNGQIEGCTMPDAQRYGFDDTMRLQSADSKKEDIQVKTVDPDGKYLYLGMELPSYQIEEDGERIMVSFDKYNFAQSDINFTMVASLKITMTKLKD